MKRRKVLVFTKNWIGDVIMQTPCFKLIKENDPNCEIVCIVPPVCQWVLDHTPYVDRIIVFNEKLNRGFKEKISLILQLRKEKFDKVYILHPSKTRAFWCVLAGIKERVAYMSKQRRMFLTHAIEQPKNPPHQTDYFVNLLRADGLEIPKNYYCEFVPTREENDVIQKKLEEKNFSTNKSFVVLNSGANWEPKRWSTSYFAELADLIYEKYQLPIVIIGSKSDVVLAESIIKHTKKADPVSFAGETDLGQLGALLSKARFVVTCDTGPMHMAGAVGTDVVALFGPTDYKDTAPRGSGNTLIIQAESGMMDDLTPVGVLERIEGEGWLGSGDSLVERVGVEKVIHI